MRDEDRVVGLAVARGLLTLEQAVAALPRAEGSGASGAAPPAGRLAALVAAGLLEEADVAGLRAALADLPEGDAEPADRSGPGPGADAGPSSAADGPAPGSGGFARFELLEVLGAGGMGTICKAWEPALCRHVAIKLLRGDDPERAARFAREAQAQARVEHDDVCRVFDVGTTPDGKPYIVMQYIAGVTLGEVREELSPEEALGLVRRVAEAVHAAHGTGLIHRDLKPGNVMVERTPDGGFRPYVLDFGLAQDQLAPGLTRTGIAMGTPQYMAPEQASGGAVDRRTDVWALGAVLYELISGRTPFAAASELDTLMRVVTEDPAPLRSVAPDAPADVETIVMKCLSRDPERRYDTARALADDLGRFLDGEPIGARPPSLGYVLGRKLRKHRTVVALTTAFLLVLASVGGAALASRLRQQERTALAQRFGQEVAAVEGEVRWVRALPLHDTSKELAGARDRLEAIRETVRRRGRLAEGPAWAAVGRGRLALGDAAGAREDLQRAWDAGYRPAEVAESLGRALGELYGRGRLEAARIPSADLRGARLAQLDRDLREPALGLLRALPPGSSSSAALVGGLVALYERRFDDALARAREAAGETRVSYEALRLEADVYLQRGDAHLESGRTGEAGADLAAAGAALARAADMARSDATVHEAEAFRLLRVLELEVQSGRPHEATGALALAAAERAIAADPTRATAWARKAAVYQKLAEAATRRGEDVAPLVERALDAARSAVAADAGAADGHSVLGMAFLFEAMHVRRRRGEDPRPALDQAAAAYDRAVALSGGSVLPLMNRGTVLAVKVDDLLSRDEDPRAAVEEALAAFRRVLAVREEITAAHYNMAMLAQRLADWQAARGVDPRPALAEALAAARRASSLNPALPQPPNVEGAVHEALARWSLAGGEDPSAELDLALEAFGRALERNPAYAFSHSNSCLAAALRARWEHESGRAAEAWLQRAEASCAKALAINPKGMDEAHNNLAAVHLLRARAARAEARDGAPSLAAARERVAAALAVNPRSAAAWRRSAEVEAFAALSGRDPLAASDAARAAAERALALKPADHASLLVAAEAELAAAEALAARGRDAAPRVAAGLDFVDRAAALRATPAASRLAECLRRVGEAAGAGR